MSTSQLGRVHVAKLYVVRPAQVNLDFTVPSSEWEISEDGIHATKDLALDESWNEVRRIYHSPELKAVATARVISEVTRIPTTVKDDLRELRIPSITPTEEFVRRVGTYLGGFADPEFEDWDEATARQVFGFPHTITVHKKSPPIFRHRKWAATGVRIRLKPFYSFNHSASMNGYATSAVGAKFSLITRGLVQRIMLNTEPALSFVPEPRDPPNGC